MRYLRLVADAATDVYIIVLDVQVRKCAPYIVLVILKAIAKGGITIGSIEKCPLYPLAHTQEITFRNPCLCRVVAVIIEDDFDGEYIPRHDQQVYRILVLRNCYH